MNRIYATLNLLIVFFVFSFCSQAQNYWSDASEPTDKSNREIVPASYRTLALDFEGLKDYFINVPHETQITAKNSDFIMEIPLPDGSTHNFSIVEAPIMAAELSERYPSIKTFAGQGIDDPTATIRFDVTHKGFHAMVISNSGTYFIDPFSRNSTELYITNWSLFATITILMATSLS